MDVTSAAGEVMCACQPADFIRFRIAAATKLSNSLKPTNVSTAICMSASYTEALRAPPLTLRRRSV